MSEPYRLSLGDHWFVWCQFQIRGAGFPSQPMTQFATAGQGLPYQAKRNAERELLRQLVQEERVQLAFLWQNPEFRETGLRSWRAKPAEPERARHRKVERTILSYLQRYHAKNDAIGFFGPIGWGCLDFEQASCQQHQLGQAWLASRTLSFEPWALEALISKWCHEEEFRDLLPLKLHPSLWVDGSRLLGAPRTRRRDGSLPLVEAQLQLLEECHRGATMARLKKERPELQSVAESMLKRGFLYSELALANDGRGENWLADRLRELPQLPATLAARQELQRLTEAQRALSPSLKLEDCEAGLGQLRQTFVEITEQAAKRHHGQTYAGRGLVYEDWQRDLKLSLGSPLYKHLAGPCRLALQVARWFGAEVRRRVLELVQLLAREQCSRLGPDFCLAALWRAVHQTPLNGAALALEELQQELRERCTEAFAQANEITSEELQRRFQQLFPLSPGPRLKFHTMDVLLGQPRGECWGLVVLGEIHPGVHPFTTLSAFSQHPQPDQLIASYAKDLALAGPRMWPVTSVAYSRSNQDARLDEDCYHLLVDPYSESWKPAEKQLRLGQMCVTEQDGQFAIRDRLNGQTFDILAPFERYLRLASGTTFRLATNLARQPRVTVDGTVLLRAAWKVPSREISALDKPVGEARFQALTDWGDKLGLPQRIFVRFPSEPKPIMVDRASILSVDMMATLARREENIEITEMLPDLEDAWLPGPPGGPGLTEFRLVLVDESGESDK